MLYQMTEWCTPDNTWHCNCVDNLVSGSSYWTHPARILKLAPADYIQYVIDNFHPLVSHNENCSLVFFSWEKQTEMRKFKNFINKKARECNYQI